MIQSFFTPIRYGQATYIALDTVFKSRHIITSLGIGTIENSEAFLTNAGQQTLEGVMHYISLNEPSTTLIFWEITDNTKITNRLIKGLNTALSYPKSAVFFICKDSVVYDSVYKALHVKHQNNDIQ
jgi:hypothetical protein